MKDVYLVLAGGLIALVGSGCALGAYVLRNGTPASWTDVVANEIVVRRTARALAAVSIVLLASAVACFLRMPWACELGAGAALVFVTGGFVGNYVVFGSLRPTHTGPNVLIAAAILWLLWQGHPH